MHRPRPLASGMLILALAACTTTATPAATDPAMTSQATASGSHPSASPLGSPETTASPAPSPATETPELFAAGVISSDEEEYRVTFSPDGSVAYFARGTGFFPQTRQATIYESRLTDGEWGPPTVTSFSGEYPDIDPWMSPDGESLYFSSIRPIGGFERGDVELFRVDRDSDGWSEPVHLAGLGSTGDELGAAVSADGRIVFASDRRGGTGGWDLYAADPSGDAFTEPAPVDALNSTAWEFNPAISADGTQLVFTSISRAGGSGLGDLYLARHDAEWSEVGPLGVNTAADEYHASWSPDGDSLYFVRRSGDGDLYSVQWSAASPPEG